MIKFKILFTICLLCLKITCQTDSLFYSTQKLKKEKIVIQAPLYKYNIYTEALGLIKGFNINTEIFLKQKNNTANYFRISLSIAKETYNIQYYPNLQGKYNASIIFFYNFIKCKPKFCYELSPGFGVDYGDPTARENAAYGYSNLPWDYGLIVCAGIRYNFKKIPIQFRLSYLPTYSFLTNNFQPIGASYSIGYCFKKLKNEQKKIQTYSNTNN